MLGNALMVAPVLQPGVTSVSAYFPEGTWYSLYDHSLVDASSGGAYRTVTVRAAAWWWRVFGAAAAARWLQQRCVRKSSGM